MKIQKIFIDKFRGFKEVGFELGENVTAIAGQNGTQKTTLLGILTQPFTISDKSNPLYGEKPLSGGYFKSAFSDKFKLSHYNFDKPKEHEWTLFFNDNTEFTVESIRRNDKEIRFWKKGAKTGGSGYVQLPVIFLSLKRLLPIGEDEKLGKSKTINLTDDEKQFYVKWHNKILILDSEIEVTALDSPEKQTLGANTTYYDWQVNSAGQDNVGKILLAILSFKRLKEKYGENYKGGILAIDEIDTTFYPGSQIKLLEALNKFSSNFNIQVIFTTHSLTLLKETLKYKENPHRLKQIQVIYLKKEDDKIIIDDKINYESIKSNLEVSLVGSSIENKINIFTEDNEGAVFVKSLLGRKYSGKLCYNKISLGCGQLISLASEVDYFKKPNSIIILDGDILTPQKTQIKRKKLDNIITLPMNKSPEQLLADFLYNLSDTDQLWGKINVGFTKQYCFRDYTYQEIYNGEDHKKAREIAKKWFNSHLEIWGRNASKVLNPWKKAHKEDVEKFLQDFDTLINKF